MPNYAIFEPTPIDAAEQLKPFITGKTIYELGAGNGQFGLALSQYAKKVVLVEHNSMFLSDIKGSGLPYVPTDLNEVNIKEADVLYFFLSFSGAYAVTRKLVEDDWHGTVISRFYPLHLIPGEYWKPQTIIHGDLPFLIYQI